MAITIPRLINGQTLPVDWCAQVAAGLLGHEPRLDALGAGRIGIVSRLPAQAAQSLPTGTDTDVIWLNDETDTDNLINLTTKPRSIRVRRPGVYAVVGMAMSDMFTSGAVLATSLHQRTYNILGNLTWQLALATNYWRDGGGTEGGTLAMLANASANDEFALSVNQNAGAARNISHAVLGVMLVREEL